VANKNIEEHLVGKKVWTGIELDKYLDKLLPELNNRELIKTIGCLKLELLPYELEERKGKPIPAGIFRNVLKNFPNPPDYLGEDIREMNSKRLTKIINELKLKLSKYKEADND